MADILATISDNDLIITGVISAPGEIIAQLSYGGNRGDVGEKGDQGIQGEQGEQGEKGDKGDPGDVSSVNLQEPDEFGNVDLRWENIGVDNQNILTDDEYADVLTIPNKMNLNGDNSNVDVLSYNTTYAPTGLETIGQEFWDSNNHTKSIILENGVTGQLFQESHIYGKNTSGAIIYNGKAVSLSSVGGSFTTFELTDVTNADSAKAFVGIATQDIAINAFGYITATGLVRDINTDSWTEAVPLYVSCITAGDLSTDLPSPECYVIKVGTVEYKHAVHGRINVSSTIYPKLEDLSGVDGTPLTEDGQIPSWHNTEGYFDFDKNINDYALKTQLGKIMFFGTCDTVAGTAAKTVSIPGYVPALGDILCIKYTNGSTITAPTLNINGTSAIAINLGGTAASTITHTIAANGEVKYCYDGTNWQMFGSMRTTDTDTNDTKYDSFGVAVTAGDAITKYKILMQGIDNKWYPITIGDTVATTKTISTVEFLPKSPILWYMTTANVAANATLTTTFTEYDSTQVNYALNLTSLISQKSMYLKGTITASGNFKLDNTTTTSAFVQDLPTTDDGFVYMYLGYTSTTSNLKLLQQHPIYWYKNGKIQEYTPDAGLFLKLDQTTPQTTLGTFTFPEIRLTNTGGFEGMIPFFDWTDNSLLVTRLGGPFTDGTSLAMGSNLDTEGARLQVTSFDSVGGITVNSYHEDSVTLYGIRNNITNLKDNTVAASIINGIYNSVIDNGISTTGPANVTGMRSIVNRGAGAAITGVDSTMIGVQSSLSDSATYNDTAVRGTFHTGASFTLSNKMRFGSSDVGGVIDTSTVLNLGLDFAPVKTLGTLNSTAYGIKISPASGFLIPTDVSLTYYGIYHSFQPISSGGTLTSGYFLYNATSLDNYMGTTGKLRFGILDEEDTAMYHDGTDFLIYPAYNGTGSLKIIGKTIIGDAANVATIDINGKLSYAGLARKQWTKYTANSVTLTNGTSANTVADLQTMADGTFYSITEATGAPGINLIVDFVSVGAFEKVRILAGYEGSDTHAVACQLYNYSTLTWDTFNAMQTGTYDIATAGGYILENYEFTVYDDTNYKSGGNVRVRLYHTMAGNASHDLHIDEVSLRQ